MPKGFGTRGGGWMATEYLQFAGALVFFLAILIGSYWFVYVPGREGQKGNDEG
jgi:cbb3-type cytochrome oxidase subunit 3